jgi:hypothetical protein
LLQAISSLGALTRIHLQVYRSPVVAPTCHRQEGGVRRMDAPKRNNVKLLVAVIGGGAIAMGALVMAVGQEQAGQESVAKSSNMNVGSTSTATTAPAVEATTMAAPAIKGPAPLPVEEQSPAAP